MEVIVKRKDLLESANLVNFIVSSKTIEEELRSIKIESKDKKISLVGTDRDIVIERVIEDCEVKKEGIVIVPAQKFVDVLSTVLDEKVVLSKEGDHLRIITGRGNFRVIGKNLETLSQFENIQWKDGIEIDVKEFADIAKKTVFAAATEQTRYTLNGIFIKIEEDRIEMVATDGKRLAKISKKLSSKQKPIPGVIASIKSILLLNKVCSLAGDEGVTGITLKITDSNLCMKSIRTSVVARLIEGHYPDYEAVIPKDCDKHLKIDVKEFIQLIGEGSVLGDRESQAVKFTFEKGKMLLSSRSSGAGDAKVEASVDYKGEDFEIAFNPLYLLEPLRAIDSGNVTFSFKESSSAALLVPEKDGYIYVVMPVDIQ